MPAGGGMDFTYGQQNEVTGGPDAGEKSRPRARETAATYKNQFMSENLSKKVVGISRIANFQQLKDTSDLKELSIQGEFCNSSSLLYPPEFSSQTFSSKAF